jgi:hypothetical protein
MNNGDWNLSLSGCLEHFPQLVQLHIMICPGKTVSTQRTGVHALAYSLMSSRLDIQQSVRSLHGPPSQAVPAPSGVQ